MNIMKSLPSVVSKHTASSISIYRTDFDLGTSIHVCENSEGLHSRSSITASYKSGYQNVGNPNLKLFYKNSCALQN